MHRHEDPYFHTVTFRLPAAVGLHPGAGSCAAGYHRYHPASLQDGWQPVPADSWAASGSWWTAFDDEALSQLVEQSLKANQTLAQAEARYRAAEAQWRQSRGARVPELGAGLGATRSGGSDRSTASQ